MVTETEIIIVGAGPAGSTLGKMLATAGLEVLILDKAAFPRRKVCGGGIPQRTVELLDCDWSKLSCGLVNRVILQGKWGRKLQVDAAPIARVVDRARFDTSLLEEAIEAGAIFNPSTHITGARRKGGMWEITSSEGRTFKAPVLCACDGANSRIARILKAPQQPQGIAIEGSLKLQIPGNVIYTDCAIFHLACIRGGYGWSFPKGDGFNVGVGTNLLPAPDIKNNLYRLVNQLYPKLTKRPGMKLDNVQGASLPFYSERPAWFASDGLYLVGDAAGLVDPLTGEGIYYAIRSADFCAEAIAKGGESRYNELVAADLAVDLEIASRYAHKAAHIPGWLISLFLGRERYRKYAEHFVEMLAGRITYRDLYARMHGGSKI